MSKKLAIKGHPTRGKEVIEILEMLGGHNVCRLNGREQLPHWVADNNYICNKFSDSENCRDILLTFTLEEFLKKYPFKIGDTVKVVGEFGSDLLGNIKSMTWNSDGNTILYWVDGYCFEGEYIVEELKPYKETNMEENKMKTVLAELIEHIKNTSKEELEKEFLELEEWCEVGPTVSEYMEFVGKFNQKPTYPKTYEECCDILQLEHTFELRDLTIDEEKLMDSFIRLKRCRDAYWKIYSEQMGLGKPWEPDWDEETDKFTISNKCNKIYLNNTAWYAEVLSFPTAEMRDTFYENFKELIEQCKELL